MSGGHSAGGAAIFRRCLREGADGAPSIAVTRPVGGPGDTHRSARDEPFLRQMCGYRRRRDGSPGDSRLWKCSAPLRWCAYGRQAFGPHTYV